MYLLKVLNYVTFSSRKKCLFIGFIDYIPILGPVAFVAGETSTTVDIATIGGDELDIAELNETLMVSLTDPSDGLILGEVNTATITILDNDSMFI